VETSHRDAKRALRSELIARRARLSPDERAEASRAIAARIEDLPAFRDARRVALYAALGTEVDPAEIARRAIARGVRVAFPRVAVPPARGPGPQAGWERRLAFAFCAPEELVRGPLGAAEPPAGAPEVDPGELGCIVMPGVAFSEDGLRLGRGGGYYDATLRALEAVPRVGLAFEVQLVPTLPREPHDALVDAIVTESRVLAFRRDSR
jgi:5-formyltetrahydrofolate cyclo-ligase